MRENGKNQSDAGKSFNYSQDKDTKKENMKPLILAIVPTIMRCQMNKELKVEVKNRIVPLKVSIPIIKEKFQNRPIQALCSVSLLIRDKTLK